LGQAVRQRGCGTGYSQPGDQVHETLSTIHGYRKPRRPSGWRYETDQIEITSLYRGLESRIGAGRKIGENQSRDPD
jgi:hypothetical protein